MAAAPLALLALCWVGSACGQVGVSLQVESNYQFRGVSLSDDQPDAHLLIAYDHRSGWFAGAALAGVEVAPGERRGQWLAYMGYARPVGFGLAGEVGVNVSHFGGATSFDYQEIFAGVSGERWSLRLSYSPDYFGRGVRTLYTELNASLPLVTSLRGFAHAGLLDTLGTAARIGSSRSRLDGRLGLAFSSSSFELQLARYASSTGGPYAAEYDRRRGGWWLSASSFF